MSSFVLAYLAFVCLYVAGALLLVWLIAKLAAFITRRHP